MATGRSACPWLHVQYKVCCVSSTLYQLAASLPANMVSRTDASAVHTKHGGRRQARLKLRAPSPREEGTTAMEAESAAAAKIRVDAFSDLA